MKLDLRLAVTASLAAALTAAAQGLSADYERAARLRDLRRNKVFRANVQPV